jgi:GNAT superfamily N-acetyltransferase
MRTKLLTRWGEGIVAEADPAFRVLLTMEEGGKSITVSRADVFKRKCTTQGKELTLGGIGGVFTDPMFRRQGFGTAVTAVAYNLIRARGWDGAILFSLDNTLAMYVACGFDVLKGSVKMMQPKGEVRVVDFVHTLVSNNISRKISLTALFRIGGLPW